jgi:hypothetical protein
MQSVDTVTTPLGGAIPLNSYREALEISRRVNWVIDDIIGGDKKLDFANHFMPESLARVDELPFLSADERRALNQIRGNEYLNIFGLVEEFILPFVMDHARPMLADDDWRTRALLQFAGEEAKHIQLFRRFREEFEAGFGTECGIIGPPQEIAKAVLAHDPLSVALVILHIEWMTQRHYIDSVREDRKLDPQFKSLLRHHWLEEAQHAKLDGLMVEALADGRTNAQLEAAFEGYLQIGMLIDGGLQVQCQLNLDSFEKATGRTLSAAERDACTASQMQALRWTYLGSGMTHSKFVESVRTLGEGLAGKLAAIAPTFS